MRARRGSQWFPWLLVGLGILPGPILRADEEGDFLTAALGRAIVKPEQVLSEVQEFTESRVPVMPKVATAADWTARADRMRADALKNVIFRGEAADWRDAPARVEWLETIAGGPGYRIKKLRYEAVPGLWIPALLYEPESLKGRAPVILNVNGHDGVGKAADYKQIRCINQARRGMLALNVEWLGMGQLNGPGFSHTLLNAIDLCGTSGIATHFLAMTRGIDVLLAHEHADPDRVAVTGLSGGGWQTIFVSAFDPRVKLSVPVAGYSSFRTRARQFSDLGDPEQTPCDLATVTDYAPMTAMLATHASALLIFNAKDSCCFAADHALPPLWEAAAPIFALAGKSGHLRSHVNFDPGDHNYGLDNRRALYRMLGDEFYPGDPTYNAEEFPCASEIKTREQLDVPLPADNADFATLALGLSRKLPRDPDMIANLAAHPDRASVWQTINRDQVGDLVRAKVVEVQAESAGAEEKAGIKAVFWRLRVDNAWTVPTVEFAPDNPKETVILVADQGRKSLAALAREHLDQGHRVLAVDPFYLGESHIPERDHLFALLVGAVGERPLGLQASQLAAIARWSESRQGRPATLVASGPRSSLAALVAGVLEKTAIAGLVLHEAPGSLKEWIERKAPYPEAPEVFCFGLLEAFDIKQLTALVAPRHVEFPNPSDRAQKELAGLKEWYGTLGVDFDPLR